MWGNATTGSLPYSQLFYRLLITPIPATPSRPTSANISSGVNVGTSAGGEDGSCDPLTVTLIVPLFVPSFDPTVAVPVCAPSESPDVSIVTLTASVSDRDPVIIVIRCRVAGVVIAVISIMQISAPPYLRQCCDIIR